MVLRSVPDSRPLLVNAPFASMLFRSCVAVVEHESRSARVALLFARRLYSTSNSYYIVVVVVVGMSSSLSLAFDHRRLRGRRMVAHAHFGFFAANSQPEHIKLASQPIHPSPASSLAHKTGRGSPATKHVLGPAGERVLLESRRRRRRSEEFVALCAPNRVYRFSVGSLCVTDSSASRCSGSARFGSWSVWCPPWLVAMLRQKAGRETRAHEGAKNEGCVMRIMVGEKVKATRGCGMCANRLLR